MTAHDGINRVHCWYLNLPCFHRLMYLVLISFIQLRYVTELKVLPPETMRACPFSLLVILDNMPDSSLTISPLMIS